MIKIFTTGGTIDDYHYDSLDKAPAKHESFISELLKRARVKAEYEVEEIMHKDSRFITDGDRQIILRKCRECKAGKIVITHGTATMPITAKFLGRRKIKKKIVLTGSAFPANKENSDALFNFGAALTVVQALPNGVYIAMNGKIFTWNNVKKNTQTGFFEREK